MAEINEKISGPDCPLVSLFYQSLMISTSFENLNRYKSFIVGLIVFSKKIVDKIKNYLYMRKSSERFSDFSTALEKTNFQTSIVYCEIKLKSNLILDLIVDKFSYK